MAQPLLLAPPSLVRARRLPLMRPSHGRGRCEEQLLRHRCVGSKGLHASKTEIWYSGTQKRLEKRILREWSFITFLTRSYVVYDCARVVRAAVPSHWSTEGVAVRPELARRPHQPAADGAPAAASGLAPEATCTSQQRATARPEPRARLPHEGRVVLRPPAAGVGARCAGQGSCSRATAALQAVYGFCARVLNTESQRETILDS
jgi:hypothetical protein